MIEYVLMLSIMAIGCMASVSFMMEGVEGTFFKVGMGLIHPNW